MNVEELLPVVWCEENALRRYKIYSLFNGKSVLDVGCGTGFFTERISNVARHVTGVDIQQENLNNCQKLDNVNYKLADFEHYNVTGHFNAVLCSEVIEHFYNKAVVMRKFGRILKSGDILVIVRTVKPMRTTWMINPFQEGFLGREGSPDTHKGSLYVSDRDMKIMTSKNGFKELASYRFRSPLVVAVELLIVKLERIASHGNLDGIGNHSKWLDSSLAIGWAAIAKQLVKFIAWLDKGFEFIDTSAKISIYKKV